MNKRKETPIEKAFNEYEALIKQANASFSIIQYKGDVGDEFIETRTLNKLDFRYYKAKLKSLSALIELDVDIVKDGISCGYNLRDRLEELYALFSYVEQKVIHRNFKLENLNPEIDITGKEFSDFVECANKSVWSLRNKLLKVKKPILSIIKEKDLQFINDTLLKWNIIDEGGVSILRNRDRKK